MKKQFKRLISNTEAKIFSSLVTNKSNAIENRFYGVMDGFMMNSRNISGLFNNIKNVVFFPFS
jgi:hypothetical protein